MIANEFINYFKKNSNDLKFEFKNFKFETLDQLTPNKMEIQFTADLCDSSNQLRDCIISNLGLNPYFYQINGFRTNHIKKFVELLEDCDNVRLNKSQIARLSFLIHLSKSVCETSDEWESFFYCVSSLIIADEKYFDLKSQLKEFYQQIISSKIINERLIKITEQITGHQAKNFNCKNVELCFFNSPIVGLNGFAGLDCIYVSLDEIRTFIVRLESNLNKDSVNKVVKLNFTRLVVHEICHVLVRRFLNNFNASSLKIFNFEDKQKIVTIYEAGVLAEKEIFEERISWLKSVFGSAFNLNYCYNFLEKILTGEDLKFDLDFSGCVLNTNKIKLMAIEFDESVELL